MKLRHHIVVKERKNVGLDRRCLMGSFNGEIVVEFRLPRPERTLWEANYEKIKPRRE